jgi:uroporphyrinogen-III synthase
LIPAAIPPLTGLAVLVTRPLVQAISLAAKIHDAGGEAVVLPAIDITPLSAAVAGTHELVVFVSVNAVEHGAHLITRTATTRIAAIGRATAAALAAANLPADIVPESRFTSEALLAHPQLALSSASRILIVRGRGGREVLQEAFTQQGCAVEMLDVYQRQLPAVDELRRTEVEDRWSCGGIDVVTATSVETLMNLSLLLSERGRNLLASTSLVVPSARVMQAALQLGLQGQCIVAAGADDQSIIGALSQWHARARTP